MKNERLFLVGDDGSITELPATIAELPEITAADDADTARPELLLPESFQLAFTLTNEQMAEISKVIEEAARQLAKTIDEIIGEVCRAVGQYGETLQEAFAELSESYTGLDAANDRRHPHPAKQKNRRHRAAIMLQCTPTLPALYLIQARRCKRLARSDLYRIT